MVCGKAFVGEKTEALKGSYFSLLAVALKYCKNTIYYVDDFKKLLKCIIIFCNI